MSWYLHLLVGIVTPWGLICTSNIQFFDWIERSTIQHNYIGRQSYSSSKHFPGKIFVQRPTHLPMSINYHNNYFCDIQVYHGHHIHLFSDFWMIVLISLQETFLITEPVAVRLTATLLNNRHSSSPYIKVASWLLNHAASHMLTVRTRDGYGRILNRDTQAFVSPTT